MNHETPNQGKPHEATLPINTHQSPEAMRRDFLKRFGGYAATAPIVTFTVFSTLSSKAIASGGGDDEGG